MRGINNVGGQIGHGGAPDPETQSLSSNSSDYESMSDHSSDWESMSDHPSHYETASESLSDLSSDYAGAAGLSSVKGKGKQKENPIDANNSASEFHAPGGSTGAAGPSTQKSDNFDSWLSSTPENVQNNYAKATDDQKAKMKENYQGVSDRLNRVGSEAKTLPANARQEVEMYKQAAETAHKDGNFRVAKENLGYAEDALRNQAASNQAGPSGAEMADKVRRGVPAQCETQTWLKYHEV